MYKVVNSTPMFQTGTIPGAIDKPSIEYLESFCHSEAWHGDLSTGLLKLGGFASHIHGLENGECGLLNLIRCYAANDRPHILRLFEKATSENSSFCYASSVEMGEGRSWPLFCVGRTSGTDHGHSGRIEGVFLFPRFMLKEDAADDKGQ